MSCTLAVEILAADSCWREEREFSSEVLPVVGHLFSNGQVYTYACMGRAQWVIYQKIKKKMTLIWEEYMCGEGCSRGDEGGVEYRYDVNICIHVWIYQRINYKELRIGEEAIFFPYL